MKNNRKGHKSVFLHQVFILVCTLIFSLIGASSALAEEGKESEKNGNNGGFTIESEKVEGAMDVLGALEGEIAIEAGIIHGLTITKTLDRGEEEGLIIKITSPGPIHVTNLNANTIDGGPPHFDGLCVSKEMGWACLEGVEMTVPKQTAENISLPDAEVETCFESECEGSSSETSMSEKEMKMTLKEMEEQEMTLEEMIEGLEDDKKKLQTIEELLKQAEKHFEKIQDNENTEHLQQMTDVIDKYLTDDMTEEEVVQFMEEDLDSDRDTSEDEEVKTDDDSASPVVRLTDEVEKTYQSYDDTTSEFLSTAEEAAELVKELEESIQLKEESLAALEAEKDKQDPEKQKQAENYKELKDKAEADKGENKEDKGANHNTQADSGSEKDSDENNEDITIDAFKKEFKAFKEKMVSLLKRHDDLQENAKSIIEEKEDITNHIKDLRAAIKESEDDYSEDIYQILMENLSFVELEDKPENEDKGEIEDSEGEESSVAEEDSEEQNGDTDSDPSSDSSDQNDKAEPANQGGKQEIKRNNNRAEQAGGDSGKNESKQGSEADP